MKRLWHKMRIVVLMVAALSSVLFTAPFASGTARRGQFPECQEECLAKHNEKMHKLAEQYKTDGNKLQYQDDVESLRLEYEACLKNCRQVYPVK